MTVLTLATFLSGILPWAQVCSSSLLHGCISNETHIGWIMSEDAANTISGDTGASPSCQFLTHRQTLSLFTNYLYHNIMPFDIPNAESLGFHHHHHRDSHNYVEKEERFLRRYLPFGGEEQSVLPDGLSDGIANITVHMALDAKVEYPWTRDIPMDVYLEYVVNFVNVNEARNNWRPLFHTVTNKILHENKLLDDEHPNKSIADVVRVINRDVWLPLGGGKKPLVFKAGQTPLIYDPMSIMAYGYGSCTGLSIVLVNALRSVGVPARLVGTPAWYGQVEEGNHNWVEVYDPSSTTNNNKWRFLEPAYGDYGTNHADNLERNPCQRWFCNPQRFGPHTGTKVYAARLDRTAISDDYYPMPWCPSNKDVPGEERTQYYHQICGRCK